MERITSSEVNELNKEIGDLSNQQSISLKENAVLKEKTAVLENKISKLGNCNITVNHAIENQIVDVLPDRQ